MVKCCERKRADSLVSAQEKSKTENRWRDKAATRVKGDLNYRKSNSRDGGRDRDSNE